jgi:hypothetical protein
VGTSKDRSGSIRSDPGGDPDRSAKLWIIAEPGSRCHTSFVRATSRFLLLIYAKTILRFLDLVVVLLLLLFPFFAFLDLSSDFRVYNSKTSFRWWRGNLYATTSKSVLIWILTSPWPNNGMRYLLMARVTQYSTTRRAALNDLGVTETITAAHSPQRLSQRQSSANPPAQDSLGQ